MTRITTESYPLAPIQEGMLFHWLLDPNSGTDVEQIIAHLREPIDAARFEKAWQSALDAFSVLRTSYSWNATERPVQRVELDVTLKIRFEDFQGLKSIDAARRIDDYIADDRHRTIDLGNAPAMRVALFCVAPGDFRMVWTFHHILIDGRAFELILNHVFASYDGEQPPIVNAQAYKSYIDWVVRADRAAAETYWKKRLAGVSAPTSLPRNSEGGGLSSPSNVVDQTLPAMLSSQLRAVADRERVSLNTLIMAAWALLLSRYSGEKDILFGATKTTRRGTIEGADTMAGLFLATIPVRATVHDDWTVGDWLRSIRSDWVAVRGHEHLPLVDIKRLTDVPASSSLFDSLVVFENYRFSTRLRAQGGKWLNRDFQLLEQTGFPLTLLAYADDALLLRLEFDTRIYHRETAERLLSQVARILEAWAGDTEHPVCETAMLSEDERRRVLFEWNNTERHYPRDIPLARLIEEQVSRTSDSVAVVFGEDRITYQRLNENANKLAHQLMRFGAAPDKVVGICIERSIEMMVALLAVVKSGAGYLPIDPFLPADRVSHMLVDSGAVAVLTQESLKQSLPSFDGPLVSMDEAIDELSWKRNSASNPDVYVEPEHLAYVIYTSGSTGKPKGVQVSRGSLNNLLYSMREWLGLESHDRLLAVTTISFDIASADVWLPWLVGAQTVLATRQEAASGDDLRSLIERNDITFLQATPVTWRLLLGAGWTGKSDIQIVCTGEALPPELAVQLVPMVRRMWNLYGPTETTIWSTGYAIERGDQPILIGRPIANTQCYILDDRLQPVPTGASGELFIAGDGVARGYLNKPELTADKFVVNPFRRGTAMYRTGDLAYFHADGSIQCLGRTDHQVKIRGFRIELGEIESLLKQHPGIAHAVVVAREDTPGEKRLVAYLIAAPHEPLSVAASELRSYLKRSLPDYMVPAAFVSLDTLPLNANGKIDRNALPAPDATSTAVRASKTLPRTYVEKQISEIWEEVFSVPEIGVTEDFFELGGHSLLALQLIAKITQVFGKQLPLNTLFESPTVESLARHIQADEKSVGQHTLVSIQATGSRPPIYWIPGGAALGLFRLRHIVTRLGPDQPVYGLGSSAPKSLKDVETVEQRATNYLALIRQVQPVGPYCLAGFCAGGRVAFEIAQRLVQQGEHVRFLGVVNCGLPRYPVGRFNALRVKLQRLRHQLRTARSQGLTLPQYVRRKFVERRQSRLETASRNAARATVEQVGLDANARADNEVLLDATIEKFERYVAAPYPGHLSIFVSDDEAGAGVSRDLDPRFAWASFAKSHEIREFPGGHDAVLEMPYAIGFAESLRAALEAASRPTADSVGTRRSSL